MADITSREYMDKLWKRIFSPEIRKELNKLVEEERLMPKFINEQDSTPIYQELFREGKWDVPYLQPDYKRWREERTI